MTDEAINKTLAELDGWTFIPSHDKQIGDEYVAMPDKWSHVDGDECWEDFPENYPTDYNPILKLIQKLDSMQFIAFLCALLPDEEAFKEIHTVTKARAMYFATPRQLCIATLKAFGKFTNE